MSTGKRLQQIQHNKKALIEALEKSLGVVTTACKAVGLDRSTFYKYYNEDAEFKAQVDDLKDVALDFVESQLFTQINGGSTAATIFFLKTRGKERGYIETVHHDHTTLGERMNEIQIHISADSEPVTNEGDIDENI